jgi:DNA-binding beta-propeller fold protein YncE/mono/diheme cytochrome c family protein
MAARRAPATRALVLVLGIVLVTAMPADEAEARSGLDAYARPRALAVDARGDLLYVALSTADRLAVVDVTSAGPRLVTTLPICPFPGALAPLPQGGVLVSCRFDPGLRLLTRPASPSRSAAGDGRRLQIRVVDAGPEHGGRGVAVDPGGATAYVASPARGGVKIVPLDGEAAPPRPARVIPTGTAPDTVRLVPPDAYVGRQTPLLLVGNFTGHTVTVHRIGNGGELSPPIQTITTAAPVLDLAVVPTGELRGALILTTHEDRPLTRRRLTVEGLDSVALVFPPAPPGSAAPFLDAGSGTGRRTSVNLSERRRGPVVEPEAMAVDTAGGRLAIAGAGSDNVVVTAPTAEGLRETPAVAVGANPSAAAFLPDGRLVTADRLSDTLTFVSRNGDTVLAVLSVGRAQRSGRAERGELLFHSRALVPHNAADGPLSLYTCAACHTDGHLDGRRHPAKRDRFFSMTRTCRGLAGTEPFLTLGEPDTFAAFADNIVGTHAQGALESPDSYDRYPVPLRLRTGDAWTERVLSPEEVRAALAAYMARIPVEPSPFVEPGRRRLTAAEGRGLGLFRDGCSGCHQMVPATGGSSADANGRRMSPSTLEASLLAGRLALTSASLYDVGTPVLGKGGNNPPSLRGVWSAAPYFSDGSAPTLEAVLRRTDPDADKVHAPENGAKAPAFSAADTADLLAFLRAL